MMGELVELKACATFTDNPCVRNYNITVKNCGAFNVYCLSRTIDDNDRYCFGEYRIQLRDI